MSSLPVGYPATRSISYQSSIDSFLNIYVFYIPVGPLLSSYVTDFPLDPTLTSIQPAHTLSHSGSLAGLIEPFPNPSLKHMQNMAALTLKKKLACVTVVALLLRLRSERGRASAQPPSQQHSPFSGSSHMPPPTLPAHAPHTSYRRCTSSTACYLPVPYSSAWV